MLDELPTEIARSGRFDGQRGHAVDELVGVLLPVVAVRGIGDGFGKGLPGLIWRCARLRLYARAADSRQRFVDIKVRQLLSN